MAVATLVYTVTDKDGNEKNINLDVASLKEIDNITMKCRNTYEVINNTRYKNKIDTIISERNFIHGTLNIIYTLEHDSRMTIPVILNKKDEIILHSSTIDDSLSEVDKARKKLFSSKNNLYIKMFLNNSIMQTTTDHLIRLDPDEYLFAVNHGLEPVLVQDDYRLSIKDILHFRLHNSKLKTFRSLFEDTLEVWKSDIYDMDEEELYFYSRSLSILYDEYLVKASQEEFIRNFRFDHKNLSRAIINGYNLVTIGKGNTLTRVYRKTKKLQEL